MAVFRSSTDLVSRSWEFILGPSVNYHFSEWSFGVVEPYIALGSSSDIHHCRCGLLRCSPAGELQHGVFPKEHGREEASGATDWEPLLHSTKEPWVPSQARVYSTLTPPDRGPRSNPGRAREYLFPPNLTYEAPVQGQSVALPALLQPVRPAACPEPLGQGED